MKKLNFKLILLFLLIAVMVLPLTEKLFHFSISKLADLKGAYVKPVCPQLNWKSFFNAEMQDSLSVYIESEISNRNALVRLRNQIAFTVFNETTNREIAVGKENYLFEKIYFEAYNKKLTASDSTEIYKNAGKLSDVIDSLKERNIDLVVVFAPSKVSVMKEYVPEKYFYKYDGQDSKYKTCADALTRNRIPFIDFNSYFSSKKLKSNYPVFTKGNAHWTFYKGCEAMDSIVSYITLHFNVLFWQYSLLDSDPVDLPQFQDDDLSSTMNLLNSMKDKNYQYPNFVLTDTTKCTKPDVLLIGDSFGWTLIYSSLPHKIFSRNFKFWDYNQSVWSEYFEKAKPIGEFDYKAELLKERVIIIIEGGLHYNNIGHGFIEQAYKIFHSELE